MSKPIIHAISDSKKFGGEPESYLEIHQWMDSSKQFIADNRHRFYWHSSAGCFYIEKIFGINYESLNKLKDKYKLPDEFIADYENQRKIDRESGTQLRDSTNRKFCPRDIAESHNLQDFKHKFIPTPQDYLQSMSMENWMNNGIELCPSAKGLYKKKNNKEITKIID